MVQHIKILLIFVSTKGNKNKKTTKTMKTMETTKTKYVIDYIYNNTPGINYYHQLVRCSDSAILYANESLDNVFLRCWELGITRDEVVVL